MGQGAPEMTWDEWEDKAVELYGDEQDDWEFRCPKCGNVQSVNSVDVDLPKEDIRRWINKCCESRFNDDIPCEFMLGEVERHFGIVVYDDGGQQYKTFAFAAMDEGEVESELNLLDRSNGDAP